MLHFIHDLTEKIYTEHESLKISSYKNDETDNRKRLKQHITEIKKYYWISNLNLITLDVLHVINRPFHVNCSTAFLQGKFIYWFAEVLGGK